MNYRLGLLDYFLVLKWLPVTWYQMPMVRAGRYLTALAILIFTFLLQGEPCKYEFSSGKRKNGTFRSPNYPKSYPRNAYCQYFFHGTSDERINITFTDFELTNGTTAGCYLDYVDVFTIDLERTKRLKWRKCGQKTPKTFISLHTQVEIIFKSSYTPTNHRGFEGHFQFLDETWDAFLPSNKSCGPRHVTGVGGELMSPNYPWPYQPNLRCTWTIKVRKDHLILITFTVLDLGLNVHCKSTFLSMYNGFADNEVTPREKICGQLYFFERKIKEFKSRTYRIVVRFETGPKNLEGSKGFRLAWTAVKIPKDTIDENGEVVVNERGEVVEEKCDGLLCKGGEVCIDKTGRLCSALPRYCIDKSLRCNSVPNCGSFDHSDEEGCLMTILLIGLSVFSGILIIIAIMVAVLIFYRRRKRFTTSASQEQSLTMTVQKLDGSPNSKRHALNNIQKDYNAFPNYKYTAHPSPTESEQDYSGPMPPLSPRFTPSPRRTPDSGGTPLSCGTPATPRMTSRSPAYHMLMSAYGLDGRTSTV